MTLPTIKLFAEEPTIPEVTIETEIPTTIDNRLQPPLKILLIGDSLINEGFGPQFEKKIKAYEGISFIRRGKYSTGLNRIDYFDWYQYTKELINTEKPDILIIMIGANDGQGIVDDDGKSYALSDTENWNNAYKKRVNRFLTENKSSVKYIFWVGHPIPRTTDFYNKFIRMNSIYESQCALYSNTIYINSWDRFAVNGKFSATITDNYGVSGTVKASDGVHLTTHGGNILSDLVIDYLNQKINLGEPRTITVTPAPQPIIIIPKASISQAQIPELFIQPGSQTTNLSKLTLSESTAVRDFTIDNLNVGTIVFTEPIDLSATELKETFSELDKYIKIEKGYVEINTDILPQLDKSAQITFYNLNLLETPAILKDEESIPTNNNISSVSFENQTLTFSVSEFSKYTIKPSTTFIDIPKETEQEVIKILGKTTDPSAIIEIFLPHNIVLTIENIDKDGNFSLKSTTKY